MSVNTKHIIRVDLLEIYERLKRYTSLKARTMPQATAAIVINESDYRTINPFIKLAFADIADLTGELKLMDDSGLDALTESGLKDWKQRLVEAQKEKEDEEKTDLGKILVVYKLPGETGAKGYVSALHEFIYEAVAYFVLERWFKELGFGEFAQSYRLEYRDYIRKIRNIGPRFNIDSRRRPVNL